jgi:hypothetical protein
MTAAAVDMVAARGLALDITATDRQRMQTDEGLSEAEIEEIHPISPAS